MTSRTGWLRQMLRALEGVLSELPLAPDALEARVDEVLEAGGIEGADLAAVRAFVRRANARAAALVEAPCVPIPVASDESAAADSGIAAYPSVGDILAGPSVGDILAGPSVGDILAGAGQDAGRIETLLRAHLTPITPSQSVEASFEELCTELAEDAGERLGGRVEDEIRQALSPTTAPHDADWAGSALESLGVEQEVVRSWARPSRAPGWLWARIRRDVVEARTAVRSRRVPVALAAATVVLSASLAVVLLHESGAGEGAGPQITFLRVDRPLSDQYASATLLQRLRDGR
jgi:hypothetical protein